jgi:transcriptional regulator of heat shock response
VLDDRKLAVLRAIVEDYVSTNEPVGSKSIVDRHNLDVSPATIRNDMAVLEEQGFIVQPHTSAGRVPTDKGYRLFVDRLSGVKPFSTAERRAIETFLTGAYDLDDVVMRTVRLLTEVASVLAGLPERVPSAERVNATAVFSVILETLVERHDEKIVVGGAANLTPADFSRGLHEVLEALEEQVVLMRLLGESGDHALVTVRIGAENQVEGLRSASVVAVGYGSGEQSLAKLGVLGPTRMDYPTAMGAVRAVARYVGQILAGS